MSKQIKLGAGARKRKSRISRFFNSTSRQMFLVLPVLVVLGEAALQQGWPAVSAWGIPFLVWGYFQCRLSASYRTRLGGGGPGRTVPPDRIVETGIYRYVRNPMYLGHMIFVGGLAVTLRSWLTLGILVALIVWYELRVREDEVRLAQLFGQGYTDYVKRTSRWLPCIY